jgi:hypothetical protein
MPEDYLRRHVVFRASEWVAKTGAVLEVLERLIAEIPQGAA